jgi:hypothetical protein
MASKGFTKPSTGQSFEAKSNGVSELPVGDPFAGQSMLGSNTMTERPPFGAEASYSEGSTLTADVPGSDYGVMTQIKTAMDAPKTPDSQTSTKVSN